MHVQCGCAVQMRGQQRQGGRDKACRVCWPAGDLQARLEQVAVESLAHDAALAQVLQHQLVRAQVPPLPKGGPLQRPLLRHAHQLRQGSVQVGCQIHVPCCNRQTMPTWRPLKGHTTTCLSAVTVASTAQTGEWCRAVDSPHRWRPSAARWACSGGTRAAAPASTCLQIWQDPTSGP